MDPAHGEGIFKRKLQDGIPLEDNTVDEIFSSHAFEHIHTEHRIFCMNECFRVLKPNCYFELIVPVIGFTDMKGEGHFINSGRAWADPTHVSYFWMPESFLYFTQPIAHADYDIRYWKMLKGGLTPYGDAHLILQAEK